MMPDKCGISGTDLTGIIYAAVWCQVMNGICVAILWCKFKARHEKDNLHNRLFKSSL